MGMKYTKEELKSFLDTYPKVEERIEELAPKLTSYLPSCEFIAGFSISPGGIVDIVIKSYDACDEDCSYERQSFSAAYLAMSDEEVGAELERLDAERKKRTEEYERKEFERLAKKYGVRT